MRFYLCARLVGPGYDEHRQRVTREYTRRSRPSGTNVGGPTKEDGTEDSGSEAEDAEEDAEMTTSGAQGKRKMKRAFERAKKR